MNSRDRHIKKEPTDLLLWMFFSFIGVLTLFNPKGHTPIPLLIAMGISFTLFAKFALNPRVVVPVVAEDIFLILFLSVSSFSVADSEDSPLRAIWIASRRPERPT